MCNENSFAKDLFRKIVSAAPMGSVSPLEPDKLDKLDLVELAQRMDLILKTDREETYGERVAITFDQMRPSIAAFVATARVMALPAEQQRKICYMLFGLFLQLRYCEVAAGAANRFVYIDQFDKTRSWQSPRIQICNAACNQWEIVSSRIAMEIFLNLIHFINTGREINTNSKFKAIRKWLRQDNPFSYFAVHVLSAFKFDREYRSPEVHGGSRYPRQILCLSTPDSNESNLSNKLVNVLLNIWTPLFEIMDRKMARSISTPPGDREWLEAYLDSDDLRFDEALEGIIGQMR